ncbi:hypothetical protein [Tenacibaculum sp. MAR_2010_89]|uniref:hypothetical protein n=1 Tax=Tenacibaculum sp. MAR_2010_89 TaxID=1250198 RepID=UPI0015A242FF|nr:hypothetical protein [Tenacibaculum sp. MAR_2010_89]
MIDPGVTVTVALFVVFPVVQPNSTTATAPLTSTALFSVIVTFCVEIHPLVPVPVIT